MSILPALWTVVLIADDYEDGKPIPYSINEYREFATRYQNKYSKLCKAIELRASY
ncbi:uncharacterized protein BJX67DRAFT_367387 [Aspergillus lucknowensis]|uniref:Uncharacterized protein n=1 Tax=Aspergillus lucknowensis TaxID=176173 RepID=A0ABR4L961_9EURO